jgi:hypothetical protein
MAAAARNVISGNNGTGISIDSDNNTVQGNFIGTSANGTTALGNSGNGMECFGGSNRIGGASAGAGNVISGNKSDGVSIFSDSNVVQGNFIGTNANGTAALGNSGSGVVFFSGSNNQIGGANAGEGNVISGNQTAGVSILGNGMTGNFVEGNFIGTDATGTTALGNSGNGVVIGQTLPPGLPPTATNNIIGGITAGARNVISGNQGAGVSIVGNTTSANSVEGNFIGTDATGSKPLGNLQGGVVVLAGASNNTIGGLTGAGSNTIEFNAGDGVRLSGGSGTVTILGANNNFQTTNIVSGTGQVGITNAIPTTSAVLVAAGATLDLHNFNDAIGSLAGAGNVTLGSGTLTIGGDNTSTLFSGIISGTGSLVKVGTGAFTLTGANT